jgi:hypothetical protein
VKVTHPFHPLVGQAFPLTGSRRSRHGLYLWLVAHDGSSFSLPKAWTSEATPDAFSHVARGRTHFRLDDLSKLLDLVDGLTRGLNGAGDADDV